jgi:hypothetical protein
MRAARIGPFLLALGLVVGVAAGVGLLVGFEPAQLPRELLNIAAYKLTFLAAGGLLAAGALALRYERRQRSTNAVDSDHSHDAAALSEGPANPSPTEGHRSGRVAATRADSSDRSGRRAGEDLEHRATGMRSDVLESKGSQRLLSAAMPCGVRLCGVESPLFHDRRDGEGRPGSVHHVSEH